MVNGYEIPVRIEEKMEEPRFSLCYQRKDGKSISLFHFLSHETMREIEA